VKQPLCGRADLLRVLLSECNETTSFITHSLGFQWVAEPPPVSDPTTQIFSSELQTSDLIKDLPHERQQFTDVPFWRVEAFKLDELIEQAGRPKFVKHQSRWLLTTEQTSPELSPWRNVMPNIRRELAVSSIAGRIDLDKTVKSLSRAEILAFLPRKKRRNWGGEVQVIVDRSTTMTPYWQDQVNVCVALERFFPYDTIQYADYRQGYQAPIVSGDKNNPYAYTLLGPGSLVIVLGDLGLLSTAFEREKWRQWGRRLQQNRCRTLALVPTEVNLANHGLQHYWRLIPWERSGGVSFVGSNPVDKDMVERLLGLISPATRIEHGFLRQVRRFIGADADAEAAVWSHPALMGKSSIAATMDPKQIQLFRARFEQESELIRKAVLKLLLDWRTHLPREIWYEEVISLPPNSQALLPKQEDLSQAYQFFHELGQGLVAGEVTPGFHRWFRDVEQRLSASAWHNEAIKPALHRMWWSTHQGEVDAVPPMDYDPKNIPTSAKSPSRTIQLYQKGAKLQLIEAEPSIGLLTEVSHGSWLGQMKSRNGEIAILPQESFWKSGQAPSWASAWGEDDYGLWVEFSLEHVGGVVTQSLRWIAPGQFLMGSPETEVERYDDEGPQHQVTISQGYWLFDTAVTQALWQVVMGGNPSHFKGDDLPVEKVSWDDCQVFLEKLNELIPELCLSLGLFLSLPTEAQWEYACRANTETSTYNGELEIVGERNDPLLDDIVWYGGNSGLGFDLENGEDSSDWPEKQYDFVKAGTRKVALKRANDWGLYDMLGNVLEWCRDGQRKYEDKDEIDPVGSLEDGVSRVVRGGSWAGFARGLRAAYRDEDVPDFRENALGLRCARV